MNAPGTASAAPVLAQSDPSRWRGALVGLGLAMALGCLWWNRISLDGMIVTDWAQTLIRTVAGPFERILGPVPVDTDETGERTKIVNLFRGALPMFAFHLAALGIVFRRIPPGDGPTTRIVLGFAILFRLLLVPYPPILETDLHRYLWDGAVLASGQNPYRFAPVEITKLDQPDHRKLYDPGELADLDRLDGLRRQPPLDRHFERINHPTIPTIYPPASQAVFAVASWLAPGSQAVYKLLVAGIDIGVILVLLGLLRVLGGRPAAVILYAWSPLILKQYSNTGHHDPIAILGVLASLLLLIGGRNVLAGAALGVGALGKLYPIVVAVALARRLRGDGLFAFVLVLGLGYLPFTRSTGWNTFDGLAAFATRWEFNSSMFAAALVGFEQLGPGEITVPTPAALPDWMADRLGPEVTLGPRRLTRLAMAALMAGVACALLWLPLRTPIHLIGHGFASVGAVFLLSPVSDPWYLGWILPFVTLVPRASWIYLSGSAFLYYLYFWDWRYLPNVRAIEYLPFYTLLVPELGRDLSGALVARRPDESGQRTSNSA